jgi:hypothetical protein
VEDWFAGNGLAVVAAIAGIVLSTLGGLLSLTPDPERPLRFVPIYILSLTIFLAGLGLILWCDQVSEFVREQYLDV